MKFNGLILIFTVSLFSKTVLAAPYIIEISQLDFSQFLPTTGNCEMDVDSYEITDLPGSQMCISSNDGSIAHYRIVAPQHTSFNIQVKTRPPTNGDGLTFSPIGKITSDIDNITIIPGQTHTASTGDLGRIDIKFGGQIIISNAYIFAPDMAHEIEMEDFITWSETP